MSAAQLSDEARAAAEAARGRRPGLRHRSWSRGSRPDDGPRRADPPGLAARGRRPAGAAFRHALSREALYADVPWLRRRALHRQVAELLEAGGGGSMEIAAHWLGARDAARAREALVRAARESEAVHAYRDATSAGRQALELWPDDEEPDARIERARALRAVRRAGRGRWPRRSRRGASCRRSAASRGSAWRVADAQRRLAAVYELQGRARGRVRGARGSRSRPSRPTGGRAEAAVERLAMADYRRNGAKYSEAIELADGRGRRGHARRAPRPARAGPRARGRRARAARRLRRGARDRSAAGWRWPSSTTSRWSPPSSTSASAWCSTTRPTTAAPRRRSTRRSACAAPTATRAREVACVTCLVYVLRERGRMDAGRRAQPRPDRRRTPRSGWRRGCSGAIHGFQGKLGSGAADARLLTGRPRRPSATTTCGSTRRRAWRTSPRPRGPTTRPPSTAGRCWTRWEESEDHHFSIWGLHWAAGYLARRGDRAGAHFCAEALSRIASDDGQRVRARRACARDRRDGAAGGRRRDRRRAALARGRDLPRPRRPVREARRSSCARASRWPPPASASSASSASRDAYRTARKLGARPLAAEAAREVAALGESVTDRLGSRAAADADGGGLTRRELRGRAPASPSGARTARWPRSCSSARGRSTCTSATSCASSTAGRESRPRTAPASSACSSRRCSPARA